MGPLAQTTVAQTAVADMPDVAWSMMVPLLVLAIGAVLLITVTSVVPRTRHGGFPAAFTITTAAVAAWSLKYVWANLLDYSDTFGQWHREWVVGGSMVIDAFTIFVWGVILLSVFLTGGMLDSYLRREGFDGPEWYALVMISAAGGMLLAAAHDLILIFLAIEVLSIAVYVLTGLHLRRLDSQEAAFKYFILGALSSAFLLFGIAMVYGAVGSTNLVEIFSYRSGNAAGLNPLEDSSLILVGMALIVIGFGFKVAAVPFHWWVPDVYQGAPTPVTGFMASAVKAAGFAGMFRVLWEGFGIYVDDWRMVIAFLAIASLVFGSFLALAQDNVKRMLAYSSIVHAGFILVGLYSVPGATGRGQGDDSILGIKSMLFYLLAYTLMTVGSFGVLTVAGGLGDADHSLARYRGLSRTRPVLAGMLTILLFAQAGVPFTAGFAAKVQVIAAAAANQSYLLAAIAMLASVVGAVLYLRVVVTMYMTEPDMVAHAATLEAEVETEDGAVVDVVEEEVSLGYGLLDALAPTPKAALLAIGFAVFGTLALGIHPNWADAIISDAANTLTQLPGIPVG